MLWMPLSSPASTSWRFPIRGGGHNVAGRALTDGGLMVDTQTMKGVHVDPASRRVRAQPGLTWNEYNRATAAYGLATTGGVVSTTGVAGLTLGGGLGWLMGKYGMAVDNVRSVEVVDANGQILIADEQQHTDLYWAFRGGGGNFGVASSFEYDAHPVSTVFGGLIAFALTDAPRVWEFFGDFSADAPDELVLMMALVHAPDGSGHKIAAVGMCHCGDLSDGEEAAAAIRSAAPPLIDMLGPLPYPVQNTLLDAGFPKGARNYWKSAYFKEITAETVALMVERFAPDSVDHDGDGDRALPRRRHSRPRHSDGVPAPRARLQPRHPRGLARRQRRRRQHCLGA